MTENQATLIDAVRTHALTLDLDDDRWGYVAHEMSDWELLFQIGRARTVAGAVKKVAAYVNQFPK